MCIRDRFLGAIHRVIREFEVLTGRRPLNLLLFAKQLQSERHPYSWRGVQYLGIPALKGYFIWESHVVQPSPAEISMMHGFPACKSECFTAEGASWTPCPLLNGTPVWKQQPHVVRMGREQYAVTYQDHYVESVC